jgi:hypothetical protein
MDAEETRQRHEATQVIATATRRGATQRRAADKRLRGAIREALARQRAEELGDEHQDLMLGPDAIQTPHAER